MVLSYDIQPWDFFAGREYLAGEYVLIGPP
jgi:hypothetical protein